MLSRRVLLFILFAFSGVFPLQNAYGQSICQGDACSSIPLDGGGYALMIYGLQETYLDEVMKDMGRAQTLANLAESPTGTVTLDRTISAGGSLSGAVTSIRTIDNVLIPGVGYFPAMPSAGVGFTPRARFGVNLGRVLGYTYDARERHLGLDDVRDAVDAVAGSENENEKPTKRETPGPFSPLRFDIYGNYLRYSYNYSPDFHYNPFRIDINFGNRGKFRVQSEGVQIRYHLFEQMRLAGPLFAFQGMSLGVGYEKSYTNFKYLQGSGSMADMTLMLPGDTLIWDGINLAEFEMRVISVPVEVQTGIQLFSAVNLTGGLGVSYNQGESSVTVLRTGQAYLQSDLGRQINRYLNGDPPPYLPSMAWLSMRMESKGDVPRTTFFMRQGIEINLFYLKLSTEWIYASDGSMAGSLGLRMEI